MPGFMFQDVVSPHAQSARKWYTVPLSFLAHTIVLAVIIVIPLLATNLPRPREIMEYVTPYVPVIPSPPPPAPRAAAPPAARIGGGPPMVAPETIGIEPGVIFQPGEVDTTGIESIVGGIDVGQAVVEALPPAVPAPSTAVIVGGAIKPPSRIKYVTPTYPAIARSAGVQGVVIIQAVIGTDGTVEHAEVVRSHPLLAEAALSAVRAWEYTPTLLNGRPTAVIMTVTVQFTLKH
jgi:periplasmic protein TonB